MTRDEVIAAWPGASADDRFVDFLTWVRAEVEDIDDLFPPLSVVRNPATANVQQLGGADFSINPDFFTNAQPDQALSAGDAIIGALQFLAMQNLKKKQKEREEFEKDARKERDKYWEKLTKDAKPKGKDQMSIYYEIYVKPIEELEKGYG